MSTPHPEPPENDDADMNLHRTPETNPRPGAQKETDMFPAAGPQTDSETLEEGAGHHHGDGAPVSPSRAALHERLRRLQRLVRRRHMAAHPDGPFADVTRGRGRVLAALRMQSPIPTRELAFLLDIRQQSLNELLKKLEADGLIERRPSQEDRRVMVVHLTDAGRSTPLGGARADYLDSLSDEEVSTLGGLLDKIIDSLETRVGPDEPDEYGSRSAGARRRMGQERFAAMMHMREHGFVPFGPAPGFGRGSGPAMGDDPSQRRRGRGGPHRRGREDRGGDRGGSGEPRRGGHPGRGGSDLPEGEFPERGAREFRPGRARRDRERTTPAFYRVAGYDC